MASVLDDIERIIGKPVDQRTDDEVGKLLPWFRKKSDVFRALKPDAVSDIIRNCEIISRNKDNVIVKQNDKGNCFFIILSGKVSVFIAANEDAEEADEESERIADSDQALGLPVSQPSNEETPQSSNDVIGQLSNVMKSRSSNGIAIPLSNETTPQSSNETTPRSSNETTSQSSSETEAKVTGQSQVTSGDKPENSSPVTELLPDPVTSSQKRPSQVHFENLVEAFHQPTFTSQPLDRSKYGQYVASLGDGKSFGELALLKKDCIRNATIITDSTVQLLVVNRQLYNRCIREAQEKEFQAKQMFVHTSEYFEAWNLRSKRQFAMSLQLRSYTYATPVVCQGHPLDYIYFLQSGQCRVIIDPATHRHQYPNYSLETEKTSTDSGSKTNSDDYIPPKIVRRGKKKGYAVRGYDICLIGASNMIGDVELSTNLPTYMQTVICEQQTEAFAIDLRNYDRLVTRRHSITAKLIAQNSLLKLNNRALRFKHIPLLSVIAEKCAQNPDYKQKKHPHGEERQRQLRKTKAASQRSSLHSLSQRRVIREVTADKANDRTACGVVPARPSAPRRSDTARMHLSETRRMNKLEARIIAWHDEMENKKLLAEQDMMKSSRQIEDYLQPGELRMRSAEC